MKKFVIWNSEADVSDEAIKTFREDVKGYKRCRKATVAEAIRMHNHLKRVFDHWFLTKELDNPILVIIRHEGCPAPRTTYKLLDNNLSNILESRVQSAATNFVAYCEDGEVKADETHHDGTNHYLYRELNCDVEDAYPLLNAISNGKTITKRLLDRYTRSLYPYVAKIYGQPAAQ